MDDAKALARGIVEQVGRVVLGKEDRIRLALACLAAGGHLLIEDIPGIGKTTLAHGLARSLGLDFTRVQFTSDLLPGDLLGVSVFDAQAQAFVYHPGPVFTQVLLADEINRATPKTQSALLEAMEEGQVTVEGVTRRLERPFFVIATQNSLEQVGTFPLPESQLDRFLMRIDLGYPDREAEAALLDRGDTKADLAALKALAGPGEVLALQAAVAGVHASPALRDYVLDLAARSRNTPALLAGLSPRAALGLVAAARAWALMEGRDFVTPEDVQAVAGPVMGHRLRQAPGQDGADPVAGLLEKTPVP